MIDNFRSPRQRGTTSPLTRGFTAHHLKYGLVGEYARGISAGSLNNFTNRYLYRHVFAEANSRELVIQVGMEVLAVDIALRRIFLLARRSRLHRCGMCHFRSCAPTGRLFVIASKQALGQVI